MTSEFVLYVKPACEKFLCVPTFENLQELKKVLYGLDNSQLNVLQSYILLPLVIRLESLNDERWEKFKCELIACIQRIISKSLLSDLNALKTILIMILKEIHDFHNGTTKSNLSEEIQLSVVECITVSLERATSDVLEQFYLAENCTILGKIAVTCVDIITREKYRKLRISAVKCLMTVFYVHDAADCDDIVMRSQVADALFLFIPKIIETLFKLSIGDDKQGEMLITTSIRALGKILGLIYEDYPGVETQKSFQKEDFIDLLKQSNTTDDSDDEILGSKSKKSKTIEEQFKTLQSTGRSDAWIGASSRKLKNMLISTNVLRINSSVVIREEYAKMCCDLAKKCSKNLKENVSTFFENIIALSHDENEKIQIICSNYLEQIKNSNSEIVIRESMEYLFDKSITRLPRIINRQDETEQLAEFLFLKGFIEFLPENDLKSILSIPGNLDRFCMCLFSVLEMKLDRELLVEKYSIIVTEDIILNCSKLKWRRFKYCSSSKVFTVIENIFKAIRNSTVVTLIFVRLMEFLQKNLSLANEIILSLTLLLGTKDENSNKYIHPLISSFMDELLDKRHWDLTLQFIPVKKTTTNKNIQWYVDKTPGLYESAIEIKTMDIDSDEDEDLDNSVTVSDVQFNVLHTCLVLDAIGNLSLSLKDNFRLYMCKILYKIIAKAGNHNYMVSEAGNYTLNCIKIALSYSTINEVIRNFSDYILVHISFSLKREDHYQFALDMLSVVYQYNCSSDFYHISNIISTLLDEISKSEKLPYISSYINIFHKLLLQFENQSMEVNFEEETESENCTIVEQDFYQNMISILERYEEIEENQQELLENITSNEEPSVNQINSPEEAEENLPSASSNEIELPEQLKIIVKTLKTVLKFISSKEQKQRILSLECLTVGLPLLKHYENELLPIVHLIWYTFVERFKDKDPITLLRCFNLLRVMCSCAKDFILQRTLKDVIPFLNDFLIKSGRNTQKEHFLTETQEFKLQKILLNDYADLIVNIEINGRELDSILEVVLLYLSRKQPKSLQELAVKFFAKMMTYDKPFVHVKFRRYLNENEFNENIKLILNERII